MLLNRDNIPGWQEGEALAHMAELRAEHGHHWAAEPHWEGAGARTCPSSLTAQPFCKKQEAWDPQSEFAASLAQLC